MKDAKGHGSDPRGAHSTGVQQVGQSPRYMTSNEILNAEVGTSGTRIVNGILFEQVLDSQGNHGWTEWDSPDRSGMRSSVSEKDAKSIGLEKPEGGWTRAFSGSYVHPSGARIERSEDGKMWHVTNPISGKVLDSLPTKREAMKTYRNGDWT